MTRLFTGDFTTGDFTQWTAIHSSGPASRADGDYTWDLTQYPRGRGDGSARIISDPDCGYALELKLTPADNYQLGGDSDWGEGTQKAQIDNSSVGVVQGDTIWVAWSQKFVQFDAWPPLRQPRNFLITNEWHGIAGPLPGGVSVFWGFPNWHGRTDAKIVEDFRGQWSLVVEKQTKYLDASVPYEREILLNVPMNLGNWIDVKMQIKFDTAANGGFIKCWINNVRQTFRSGTDTWNGQVTAPFEPPGEKQFYNATIYRSGSKQVDATHPFPWGDMVMQIANHRSAATESGL